MHILVGIKAYHTSVKFLEACGRTRNNKGLMIFSRKIQLKSFKNAVNVEYNRTKASNEEKFYSNTLIF